MCLLSFLIDWVESVFVCVCVLLQLEIYLLPSCFHCWPGRPHRCEYCHVNLDHSSSSSHAFMYIHDLSSLFLCRDNLTSRAVRGGSIDSSLCWVSCYKYTCRVLLSHSHPACPSRNLGCMTWRRCGKAFLCWYVSRITKYNKCTAYLFIKLSSRTKRSWKVIKFLPACPEMMEATCLEWLFFVSV